MSSPKNEKRSFEDNLAHLESMIESMENGDTALDELITKFEEGSALLKICQKKLNAAELKIERLNLKTGELEPIEDNMESDL